jgi:RHS repeat-associated protein
MTNSQSGIVTTTNYHTDFPYYRRVSSQTRTLSGVTLGSVVNTWSSTTIAGLGGTHYYFVSLSPSVVSGHDLNGATLPTTTSSYTYDAYGNPLTVTVSVSDGSSSTTTNTFNNDTTNWLLGQLLTKSVQNIVGSSNLTRHFSYGHDSGSGLLNQVILEPSNSTYKLQADYTLDAFGHATTTALSGLGIASHSSSVGYDTLGEFATSTTNALSQGDSTGYSSGFGIATSHTDINGQATSLTLDTLGRPTLQTLADGTKGSLTYLYCSGVNGGTASCPTYGAYLLQTEPLASDGTTQIGPIETTYYDALGRVIASDSQGFDGSNRRVATQHDSKGRVSQTSRPYFTIGGTAKWTVYTYDALDRVTKAVFPDTSQTTYTFNGLTTSLTNNLSQTTSQTFNAQGLPASVTDAASHVTHYVYDAFNDLTSVTDPSGNIITNTYDIRGRRTGSADPDMGSWIYNFDVLSELTSQTDAKSQITNLTYDLLGRVTERSESGMVSDWIYDTAIHGIGRPQATCTSPSSNPTCTSATTTKTFMYDTTGRPSNTTINTDSTNFGFTTTYNATNGGVDTVTHPSGLVTKNVYNSYGYLCSITDTAGSPTCTSGGGSNVFFTANIADAELHLLQQTAGNSVVTTNTFDANTGLLTNVRAGPSNAVAQFDYTYDTIGNLTYRSDDFVGVFERFCYDNLNRLTNSATGASGVTTCTSSGSGITTKTIGYDQLGNISSKSDVGTYSYPASGSGSVQPHAVSSIAGTVNGVTNPSYTYDLNGNMTVGAGLTATYTSFNMAATITQGSTTIGFTYDSDHQRIKQCIGTSCATSTTYYLNDPATGAMSEQFVVGTTTTWRDFLRVNGQIVGERFSVVGGSTSWSYFTLDHLGSVAVNSDGTGNVSERLSYDAWGRRRNSDGTDNAGCAIASATTRGFTGHEEMDSICGVNASARIYDPTIGRFMAADSLIPRQLAGQSFNRYSYVENEPLSRIDPSGNLDTELHPAPVSGGIETVVVTAEVQPPADLQPSDVKSGDFLEVASGSGNGNAPGNAAVVETVVVTAERYASSFVVGFLPSLSWINAHVIGSRSPDSKDMYGKCDANLVAIGNYLEDLSQKTGNASGAVVVGGAATVVGGAALTVGGAPEVGVPVAAAGVDMMNVGANAGLGAGALQLAGGVFQGLGGAGYSNALNSAATLGASAVIAGAFKTATYGMNTASGRAVANFMGKSNTFVGAAYDAVANQATQLGPQQKTCSGR